MIQAALDSNFASDAQLVHSIDTSDKSVVEKTHADLLGHRKSP